MKKGLLSILFAGLAGPALAQNVPQVRFTSFLNFPNLLEGQNLGEVPGVAVNSNCHQWTQT